MNYWIVVPWLLAAMLITGSGKRPGKDDQPKPDPHISQKDNDFIDRQDRALLDTVSSLLAQYPPVPHEGRGRSSAKLLLDAILHDQYAAFRKPVREFFNSRIDTVIRELENSKAGTGATIWKIYNMGFIVRTRSVTIAFDLVSGISSGSKGFALSDKAMERLIRQCDILFISHKHGDHAEKEVAEAFLSLGKPVVAPEQVWKDEKRWDKLTHLERNPKKTHQVPLPSGKTLGAIIYPGHQMASVDVNVVLVKTPEGLNIVHLGDQINEGDFMPDFSWIDNAGKYEKVDIMIPNCWTNDIDRIARGFNPGLIVPGHENELGHNIADRVPFWGDDEYLDLKYSELKKSAFPVVVMAWGEEYKYLPANNKKK